LERFRCDFVTRYLFDFGFECFEFFEPEFFAPLRIWLVRNFENICWNKLSEKFIDFLFAVASGFAYD